MSNNGLANPTTPEEIGTLLTPTQKGNVQDKVNHLLGWGSKDVAPMAMAVPMLRNNRKQIMDHGYLVGSLWTGIRYLALLVCGRCYLISHNYDIRETWLFAPLRQHDRVQPEIDQHNWTILDGVLVMNQVIHLLNILLIILIIVYLFLCLYRINYAMLSVTFLRLILLL